jgi:hypothetical protein
MRRGLLRWRRVSSLTSLRVFTRSSPSALSPCTILRPLLCSILPADRALLSSLKAGKGSGFGISSGSAKGKDKEKDRGMATATVQDWVQLKDVFGRAEGAYQGMFHVLSFISFALSVSLLFTISALGPQTLQMFYVLPLRRHFKNYLFSCIILFIA